MAVRLREQLPIGAYSEALLREHRRSPRRNPERPTDIKLEVGRELDRGHALQRVGARPRHRALHDAACSSSARFESIKRSRWSVPSACAGKIRSQYPADGGCVLGIELKDRFQLKHDA